MKDINKKLELLKRLPTEAEDKYKCLSIQHDKKTKETPRGGQVNRDKG